MSKHYKITLLFGGGDPSRLMAISQYADVLKYTGQEFSCDTFIWASAWGTNPEATIKANRYIQMIHADYECIKGWNFKYKKPNKCTHHVAVGKHVGAQFEKVTSNTIDQVIYNLVDDEVNHLVKHKNDDLKLITVSRISPEKGFSRMITMLTKLNEGNVKYTWDIYGNTSSDYAQGIVSKLSRFDGVKFHGVLLLYL
ncbi:hypothetical protein FK004_12645 [Flavobacterium kingsejongi]|uniref:Uncharacterized protein n=2 Tax=Flavobacterium kingsejongi TaxID=1678728 RepID=A0A2S1LQS8_9FLAO|nr:hypothetical protein FK004_12645 [Flavobacterium kingsejongi]